MTTRDYLMLGLILIVLVIVLALVNFYYIQPRLTPKLPEPKKLPPVEHYKPPVDRNIVATTLEKVKAMFPQKEFQKEFEPRRVKRNPFFWPDEIAGERYVRRPGREKEKEERGLPRLSMILIGEKRKIALINDKIVFEGSQIDGDKVHRIDEKEVILKGETGETRLSLAEYTFTPSPEEEVAIPEKVPETPAQEETMESLFEKLKPLLHHK